MAEAEFKGTSIEKGKGEDEFLEVENLIKETLAESKVLAPPPSPPKEAPKEEEFKGTTISPRPAEKPAAPPKVAKPAPQPKPEATTYEETFKEYKAGDIVKGTVLKVDPGGVLVDIKYKADGLILPEELSDKSFGSPSEVVKVGDVLNVLIENLENKEGYVVLSKKQADHESAWRVAYDAYKKRSVLEGKVVQVVRGG
ncbi:MAG: S1 RNA-binding domain-containing protein, partial [Candidatus Margulisiibacteriota bacterium]